MNAAKKAELEAHWMTRALRATRAAYVATGGDDILYQIIDAACLKVPLFPDEPWLARPTPQRPKQGGVVRFRRGTKDKALFAVVMDPRNATATPLDLCDVSELVDNLGRLLSAISATPQEQAELLDKVRRWIVFDDTLDETPDKVSWAENERQRALTTDQYQRPGNRKERRTRSRRGQSD